MRKQVKGFMAMAMMAAMVGTTAAQAGDLPFDPTKVGPSVTLPKSKAYFIELQNKNSVKVPAPPKSGPLPRP
jgi:hypothetical protein